MSRKMKIVHRIHVRLAELENITAGLKKDSVEYFKYMQETKLLKCKLQDAMNSQCPLVKN